MGPPAKKGSDSLFNLASMYESITGAFSGLAGNANTIFNVHWSIWLIGIVVVYIIVKKL